MELSIIIPTHNRPKALALCLQAIANQADAPELEVIVIDDMNDPETKKVVEGSQLPKANCQLLVVPPCHQGTARNRGIEKASAPYVLIIGDDALLAPNACRAHYDALTNNTYIPKNTPPYAVLGFTTWDPEVGITYTMHWLEKSGWQFGYPMIEGDMLTLLPTKIQHRFTYTINISLPTHVARTHRFREDVTLYGWEDMEWGMRLCSAGVGLFYEPRAKALHHHKVTLKDSLSRMETLGRSVVEMETLLPGFDRRPKGLKLLAYEIASKLPTMAGRHRKAFLRGIKNTGATK